MNTDRISRRNFLQKTSVTAVGSLAAIGMTQNVFARQPVNENLPREVWIAGLSQERLYAQTSELMTDKILEILKELIPYQPDFVCLPEAFPFCNVDKKYSLAEKLQISEEVIEQFAGFSKQNNCYTICPVYTTNEGKIYNSAVVLNREGKKIGSYNKIHEVKDEILNGITPGSLFQPVIMTDFGPIGIQICFDIRWDDGWKMLREQGAKIIFWASAYGGGAVVNTKAWQHQCIVASSTNKSTSKLCDISGGVIASTGIWNKNLYCAPVNMEKIFLDTWPNVNRFNDIQNKYGRKVRITTYHEEEWSIIESLSPEIYVKDILKEFDLETQKEHIKNAEIVQNKARL